MWGYVLQHVLVMVPLALAVQGVEADCGEQGEEEAFSEGLGEVWVCACAEVDQP